MIARNLPDGVTVRSRGVLNGKPNPVVTVRVKTRRALPTALTPDEARELAAWIIEECEKVERAVSAFETPLDNAADTGQTEDTNTDQEV